MHVNLFLSSELLMIDTLSFRSPLSAYSSLYNDILFCIILMWKTVWKTCVKSGFPDFSGVSALLNAEKKSPGLAAAKIGFGSCKAQVYVIFWKQMKHILKNINK